jgi:hypothetical protein
MLNMVDPDMNQARTYHAFNTIASNDGRCLKAAFVLRPVRVALHVRAIDDQADTCGLPFCRRDILRVGDMAAEMRLNVLRQVFHQRVQQPRAESAISSFISLPHARKFTDGRKSSDPCCAPKFDE